MDGDTRAREGDSTFGGEGVARMKNLESRLDPQMTDDKEYCHAPLCWNRAKATGFCEAHNEVLGDVPFPSTLETRRAGRAFFLRGHDEVPRTA